METTTQKRSHPIPFSTPMIKALQTGKKTQTRRVVAISNSSVLGHPAKTYWPNLHFDHAIARTKSSLMVAIAGKDAPLDVHLSVPWCHPDDMPCPIEDMARYRVRPKWDVGDKLWVKETWAPSDASPELGGPRNFYRADDGAVVIDRWRSGRYMPKSVARIWLEVIDLRVERLVEISQQDAMFEGFSSTPCARCDETGICPVTKTACEDCNGEGWDRCVTKFRKLWEKLNGKKHPWISNPWVWVIGFQRIVQEKAS